MSKIPFLTELELFHQASQIPLCVFDNTPKDLLRFPYISTLECSHNTLLLCCETLQQNGKMQQLPLLYSSDSCIFALMKLDTDTNLMIGPISSMPLTYRAFCRDAHSSFSLDDLLHLYRIVQQAPHLSLVQFCNHLALLLHLLFQRSISSEALQAKLISLSKNNKIGLSPEAKEPPYIIIDEMIAFQKDILFYIQRGKIQQINEHFQHSPLFFHLDKELNTAEELMKIFFIYATLCCVTVLEAGLDVPKAFPIFDIYVAKIPTISLPVHLKELCRQISIDYCKQMLLLINAVSSSPVVTKCMHYIQDNLCSKITIEDLAQHCNVSSRTITRHFTEYEQISVSEYIMQCKLKKAAFLLTHSALSLSEISNHLAFSSQSHFSVAFKKKYSYTPQNYRSKYQPDK